MKFFILTTAFFMAIRAAFPQSIVEGKVTDKKEVPLAGVNVYIKGSYDGASTDTAGIFSFKTSVNGNAVLIASCIGFKTFSKEIFLDGSMEVANIILRENLAELDAVVITAGTFEAGDEKKSVVLKPLDIVTTAGGLADIPGAINTLPGTSTVGEEGKLFVRGGDSYETKTFVDGMIVAKPYESTVPDVPSRGKFSPFLFNGTAFSSGGYSAEYGQALSSALILQTSGLAPETVTGLSFMSLGTGASHTQRWDRSSVSVSLDYINLDPYFKMFPQTKNWPKAPEGIGSSLVFRQKIRKEGLIKVFASAGNSLSGVSYPVSSDIYNYSDVYLSNKNRYINASYKDILGDKWISFTGISFSSDEDLTEFDNDRINERLSSFQVKQNLTFLLHEQATVKFGGDLWRQNHGSEYKLISDDLQKNTELTDIIASMFAETEIKPAERLAIRIGARAEYYSENDNYSLSPRLSMAFKTGAKSQVSFAYGSFCQTPEFLYRQFAPALTQEKATHYILNYQLMKNRRTFRIEGYWKDYENLVVYDSLYDPLPQSYSSSGNGYARGIDVFWRDNSFGNHEYWISASIIDSKRKYHDFPVEATPSFITEKNLSLVYKYFIPKITTQIGLTYKYASGRSYDDPNNSGFMTGRTKDFHDLSLNISYLTNIMDQFTIVYISVSNLPGFDNEFGYRYSATPGTDGTYDSYAIKPGAKRFLFAGVFISIDKLNNVFN